MKFSIKILPTNFLNKLYVSFEVFATTLFCELLWGWQPRKATVMPKLSSSIASALASCAVKMKFAVAKWQVSYSHQFSASKRIYAQPHN